ncbi:MAG: membrane protein insertase YidC [Phocaeicola sp.]|uniref:membrane protein insertase YidC n=1 Tax=Phocaeicola sp. TaxID=2773926 RepID=UPI003F9F2A83
MDKNTLVGFVLIGTVLIGFSIYNRPSKEDLEQAHHYQDSIQAIQKEQSNKVDVEVQKDSISYTQIVADSTSAFYSSLKGTEQEISLENNLIQLKLSNKGGTPQEAILKSYKDQNGQPLVVFDKKDIQMDFSIDGKNENILTNNLYFTPTNVTDSTVTMRLQINGGGTLDFNYKLLKDSYVLNFSIQANNMQNFFPSASKSINLNWHQKIRHQEKGYSFEQRYTALTYKRSGHDSNKLSEGRDANKEIEDALDWIAFKGQFFSTIWIAHQDFNNTILNSKVLAENSGYMKEYNANMTTSFDPTGKEPTNMQMYIGPNRFNTLKATNKICAAASPKSLELQDLVYLGWPIVRLINRYFTIPLFDWLSGWGLSMGIVLLLMTFIVKSIVYPATYKSYMSSAKMRALKPYMDKINEKYPNKDDALKKQQEMMSLYSQYGVSPMGGCLPMLVQMPVFMALFFFVPNAIELRQQSFLWASDLSAYDDVINWGTNLPIIGDHLSLFCVLFSASSLLNTYISMKMQDPMGQQQQMPAMKWMMYLMPLMFFFIFNTYSSGLNYYYFISGLISIITMVILRKTTDEKKLLAKLETNKVKIQADRTAKGSRGGMMAKLEALKKEQERIEAERQKTLKNKH